MSQSVVLLACGHYVKCKVVLDRAFQEEFCPTCNDWKDVWEEWKEQWHSKCNVCSYGRSHGQSKSYAELAANRHHRQTNHRVSVGYYGGYPPEAKDAVMAESRHMKEPEPFPDFPPF